MTRLPTPGSDTGAWGDILNTFLNVEHNADGTLKASGSLAAKANDTAVVHLSGTETITGAKTFSISPSVPTPSASSDAATKAYVDATAGSGAANATTSTPGIIQLGGDLAGVGTAYTAPVITDGAITNSKLATGSVTTIKLGTGAVTASEIALATIVDANVSASAAIAKSKLAALNIADADVASGANIAQSKISGLSAALTAKADDTTVMHLSGTETVTGNKNFTGTVSRNSNTLVDTTDARLSDSRNPLAHASTHAAAGSDPLTPTALGAVSVKDGGKETVNTVASAGATPTISLASGNVQMVTLSANATISLTGATNGVACSLSLYLVQNGTGGWVVTWPASVKWPGGLAPSLSSGANKIDLIILETLDGGTTWFGALAGADYR